MWNERSPRVIREETKESDSRDNTDYMKIVVIEGEVCGFENKAEPVESSRTKQKVNNDSDIDEKTESDDDLATQICQLSMGEEDDQTKSEIS